MNIYTPSNATPTIRKNNENTLPQEKTGIGKFIAALFLIVPTKKQSKCPEIGEII
jgi:hypothetical protein